MFSWCMNLLTIVLTCSYVLGGSRHGLGSSMTWKPCQRKSRTGLFPFYLISVLYSINLGLC